MSDPADAQALAGATREQFGGADVLVNNAGVGTAGAFLDLEHGDWQRVIDLNLSGAFNCSQAVATGMAERSGGRIVNVSSMTGRNVSYHGAANYTASKWGLIGLTKHMVLDLAEHDI